MPNEEEQKKQTSMDVSKINQSVEGNAHFMKKQAVTGDADQTMASQMHSNISPTPGTVLHSKQVSPGKLG